MENIIPLGEPTDIYADLVYTPTERKLSVEKNNEDSERDDSQTLLDWASNFLSTYAPKAITKEKQDTVYEPTPGSDTSDKQDSWSDYWSAWSDTSAKPKAASYSGSNFEKFKKAYTDSGVSQNEFDFWASLADHESGFDNRIQNRAGAPAYGYFQFMEGKSGKKIWDNITKFAGVDIETFRNNPVLQIQAAHKMKDKILEGFSDVDKKRAQELGYTNSALVRGAWLAGVKGVKRFLHQGINASDNHWDKKNHRGSNVKAAMDAGNGYFSEGGILKTK